MIDADGAVIFRGLRVRAGLHIGHPECRPDPTSGRMDYFGPMVNRAARVSGAAHGGQVLATREAWMVAQSGARGITAEDLGSHQLKGLGEAIPLVQICPPSHRRRFPPLKRGATNLRPSRTRFIGRGAELDACCARLEGGARILTILGPGGCGKTRLSRSVAARQMDAHAGGAWFVELAEALSLGDIVAAVAAVLSVPLAMGSPHEHVRQLGRALAARDPLILVLDNVEQVIDAAAEAVGYWIETAPGLRIVATSRQRLHVGGEAFVELGPLCDADALALFIDRAEEAAPGFARTDERILAITRCVDSIPLAIELAAARVSLLPLPALLKRLKESPCATSRSSMPRPLQGAIATFAGC